MRREKKIANSPAKPSGLKTIAYSGLYEYMAASLFYLHHKAPYPILTIVAKPVDVTSFPPASAS
jgi:hypothetical protein